MKKLVVITSRFPFPLDKGDKLRAYHQIKELAKSMEVHLISVTNSSVPESDKKVLENLCASVTIHKLNKIGLVWSLFKSLFNKKPFQVALFYNKVIHNKISKQIKELNPNHIYCQLIRCAEYVKDEYDIRKTIDFMDVLSKGIERRITSSSFYLKKLLKIEAERLKVYEHIMFEYFDNHSIISLQDQELIYHTKRENITIIPNGIDSDFFKPDANLVKKYTLLFNGNMQYQPNVKSAQYIVEHVLPIVIAKYPEANLLISGTSPTKEVLALASESVTISGWIDDIRDAYNSAHIFIAPMQIGTGLQNKLLEAMAMKMPCVTSKLANNALNATPGNEILIGNSKEEYAQLIINLIENNNMSSEIGKAGQDYVCQNFNWASSVRKLKETMNL
ncbi:glycosyltransferase [Flavobacteriales bacterium]|jgi:sugar transferase (PEP-CTERM/EpsH1 system associated)|nr:glycosyltransferase [Flavobacteriales bacterium]